MYMDFRKLKHESKGTAKTLRFKPFFSCEIGPQEPNPYDFLTIIKDRILQNFCKILYPMGTE